MSTESIFGCAGGLIEKAKLTREGLLRAHHLPGAFYASPDIFEMEVENIFMKDWICVARIEEFDQPGDYKALRILNESIVICRDREGELRAFRNMCRHRGVEVAPLGSGNKKRFTCPYHAWTYDLTGQLVGAARTEEIENFDRKTCRLPVIKFDTWGGYVFINFDENCISLGDYLDADDIREFAAFIRPEDTRTCFKYEFEIECNWKFVSENLIDIYHVAVIHADTFGGKNFTIDDFRHDLKKYSYTDFFRSDTFAPGGATLFKTLPWLEGKVDEQFACTTWVRPNMNIFGRHDMVHAWTALPMSVDRTLVTIYIQIPPECFDDPLFEQKSQILGDFMKLVSGEDAALLRSLQNAARSKAYEPGRLANQERGIHHMLNYWLDRIVGPDEQARQRRLSEGEAEFHNAEKRYGGAAWDPTQTPSRYDEVLKK